ncbi:hypothetical protein [Streptomyces longispororuber]|uniref:hypothetical protein n=1 Tax=Streptomyces longispororuber TaxID=68230 RepID=UPI0036FC7EF9
MTTWIVFVTVNTIQGKAVSQAAASRLENTLTASAGRTGMPGVDPEVTITADDRAQIRQSFPMTTAFQAVTLAQESLWRSLHPDDVDSIRTIRLDAWEDSPAVSASN